MNRDQRFVALDGAAGCVLQQIREGEGLYSLVRDVVTLLAFYELTVSDGVKLNENFPFLISGVYGKYPGLREALKTYLRAAENAIKSATDTEKQAG